jgi:DNA-binding MarR family transcriptional regulator
MSDSRQQDHHPDIRLQAWRAILETYATLLPLFDAELRESVHLEVPTYDALLHAYEAGSSGIRMTDLAQKVVLTKSGLTARVDRLERQGLLQRVPDPNDRRATRITLTDRGTAVFREAAFSHMADIARHFSRLISVEEAQVIVAALERVQQGVISL